MKKLTLVVAFLSLVTHSSFTDVVSTMGKINFDVNDDQSAELVLSSIGLGIGAVPISANLHVDGNAIVSGEVAIGGTSGGSNLTIHGTYAIRPIEVSSSGNLGENSVVVADTSSRDLKLTLPTASDYTGTQLWIKKSSSYHTLSILGFDSPDHLISTYPSSDLPSVQCFSDGSKWHFTPGVGDWQTSGTIAYYRFSSSELLNDSSGLGNHLTQNNTITQTAIPGAGDGSNFPTTLTGTGESNDQLITFNTSANLAGFYAADSNSLGSIASRGQFTVECFLNIEMQSGAASPEDSRYIASQYATTGNQRSWSWQINTSEGFTMFLSGDGASASTVSSTSVTISDNKDYYVAVSYDAATTTAVFYWQNLTDGGTLQSETVVSGPTSLFDTTAELTVGYRLNSTKRWGDSGYMDEVRISNTVLSSTQLLISQ